MVIRILLVYLLAVNVEETCLSPLNETQFSETIISHMRYGIFDKPSSSSSSSLLSNGLLDYQLVYTLKWTKHNLSWHYEQAQPNVLKLAEAAFNVWSQHSNLTFYHDQTNPDILISNKYLKHTIDRGANICPNNFDGKGSILAHAFYPISSNSSVEIHIDGDETWHYNITTVLDANKTSLFEVLIHEIGHAIGLTHSNDSKSIMFKHYNGNLTDLSSDDIERIQRLYGPPARVAEVSNVTRDLCDLRLTTAHFVFINKTLYIIDNNFVWSIDQNTRPPYYKSTLKLTDWANFIPKDYRTLNGLYQRPNRQIVLIVDNIIYVCNINKDDKTCSLNKQYSLIYLGICSSTKINAVFNTYTGQTFIFYSNIYYIEVDECKFRQKETGIISDKFPSSLPSAIDGAFRYSNGVIYFIKSGEYYGINQFTDELIESGKLTHELFNITCSSTGVEGSQYHTLLFIVFVLLVSLEFIEI
jgi:hypothetical protein